MKKIGREIWLFLSSKVFLKNFVLIMGLIGICLFICFSWMKVYTKHGKSYEVNNFIGKDLEQAKNEAKEHNFNLVLLDSTYIPGRKPNVVLEQNPLPGSMVKENRTIYLSITKMIADEIELPDLVGNYDANNYQRKLQRKGFQASIAKEVFDEMLAPNTILYVQYNGKQYTDDDIRKGVKVPKGENVELVVSKRSSVMVDMPDLMCMKYSEAKFLLQTYDLNIGNIVPDATVQNEKQAFIWKQNPGYSSGKMLRKGEAVNLYLTQYKPSNCN